LTIKSYFVAGAGKAKAAPAAVKKNRRLFNMAMLLTHPLWKCDKFQEPISFLNTFKKLLTRPGHCPNF